MNSLEIQSIINAKEKRQFVLEERMQNIKEIEENLDDAFILNSFQGFYYKFKRFFLLFIAVAFIIISLILFVKPEIIVPDNFKNEVVNSIAKMNLNHEIRNYNNLDFEKANNEYRILTLLVAGFILFFSLILLYISRLTKKLKNRNDLILKSDDLAHKIIDDYTLTLNEEKEELRLLKRAYLSTSHI